MSFIRPKRDVAVVYLHCSASDNPAHDDIKVIKGWHLEREFFDVGYHFFIRGDGTIEKGRDLEYIPAAQIEYNTGSIAICCHGLKEENFTEEQEDALFGLCNNINNAYGGMMRFRGHCEVSTKSCPVFNYRKWLNLDAHGYIKKQENWYE